MLLMHMQKQNLRSSMQSMRDSYIVAVTPGRKKSTCYHKLKPTAGILLAR
jgi:hypothetical protein